MDNQNTFYATGKRKSAIAKTWLTPGSGQITVNKKPLDEYFRLDTAKMLLSQPFAITNTNGEYDVKIKVLGGGVTGQANAIRHGITKALILANPDFRGPLSARTSFFP